jgi:hypothetical protein
MGMVSLPLVDIMADTFAAERQGMILLPQTGHTEYQQQPKANAEQSSVGEQQPSKVSSDESTGDDTVEPVHRIGVWMPLQPMGSVATASSVEGAPMRNEIRVTALRASGLSVMDKALFGKGSSDPFVGISCVEDTCSGSSKKNKNGLELNPKSSVIKKSLTPSWGGEVLSIAVPETADMSAELVITVSDWDRIGANDLMGRVTLRLGSLLAGIEDDEGDDDSDVEGHAPEPKGILSDDDSDDDDGKLIDDDGNLIVRPQQPHPVALERAGGRRQKHELVGDEDKEGPLGEISFRVQWLHNPEVDTAVWVLRPTKTIHIFPACYAVLT